MCNVSITWELHRCRHIFASSNWLRCAFVSLSLYRRLNWLTQRCSFDCYFSLIYIFSVSKNITNSLSSLLPVCFLLTRERQCFAVVFLPVCAQTHAHQQASKQVSEQGKLFLKRCVSLRWFSSLPTPSTIPSPSFSFILACTHTSTYTTKRNASCRGPCCASRTLSCERVFSTHFAAVCNHRSPSSHTQLRRTYTHTQSKAKLLIYTTATAYAIHVWKRSETRRQRHTHTHIRHVHAFSLAVDSSS